MTDARQSIESWNRSAEAWIEFMRKCDLNRTLLLDEPMLELAGDVSEKRVLDAGCGEGRFCRMLRERGATAVGIDPTARLLREAWEQDPLSSYVRASAEALPFACQTFDLVVAYLVLIDIPDYRRAILEMARVLRPGGRLLIANLQSFATTRQTAWYRDERGVKLHVAVEEYFTERAMLQEWANLSILNWHRPFEAYMSALLDAGLRLTAFREPRPKPEHVALHPRMADESKVPTFHIMLWEKS